MALAAVLLSECCSSQPRGQVASAPTPFEDVDAIGRPEGIRKASTACERSKTSRSCRPSRSARARVQGPLRRLRRDEEGLRDQERRTMNAAVPLDKKDPGEVADGFLKANKLT
jgi:hypothetical protein